MLQERIAIIGIWAFGFLTAEVVKQFCHAVNCGNIGWLKPFMDRKILLHLVFPG